VTKNGSVRWPQIVPVERTISVVGADVQLRSAMPQSGLAPAPFARFEIGDGDCPRPWGTVWPRGGKHVSLPHAPERARRSGALHDSITRQISTDPAPGQRAMHATDRSGKASKATSDRWKQFDPMAGFPTRYVPSRDDRLEPSLANLGFSAVIVARPRRASYARPGNQTREPRPARSLRY